MAKVRIKVNKPVALPEVDSGQRLADVRPGVHEVDERVLQHWFVRSLIKSGAIVVSKKTPVEISKTAVNVGPINIAKPPKVVTPPVTPKVVTPPVTGEGVLISATGDLPPELANQVKTVEINPVQGISNPQIGQVVLQPKKTISLSGRRQRKV